MSLLVIMLMQWINNVVSLEHSGDMSSFRSVRLFGTRSLVLTFPVRKNSQLFFAVLVENQLTYFGTISCNAKKWLHKGVMCDMTTVIF